MYNRYIPQPDGSYRRRQMEDSPPPPRRKPGPPPPQFTPTPQQETPQHISPPPQRVQQRPLPPKPKKAPESMFHFLKQLLPRDFDTEDLLIILLLLLMSGDCKEDQNTALLTLAIYLFL